MASTTSSPFTIASPPSLSPQSDKVERAFFSDITTRNNNNTRVLFATVDWLTNHPVSVAFEVLSTRPVMNLLPFLPTKLKKKLDKQSVLPYQVQDIPQPLKTAVIKPLLKKKKNHKCVMNNYRSVSNLPFIGKNIEKPCFNSYMTSWH